MKQDTGKYLRPFAVVVPVVALALAAVPRQPRMVRADHVAACTATLDPDTVAIGSTLATVKFNLSEDIGRVASVTADQNSGLRVDKVNQENRTFDVSTSGAAEGDWSVSLAGEMEKTCAGSIHVIRAPKH